MTGVLYIIPYKTALSCLGCALSSKSVLFAAEEGVDIKAGRETYIAVLSYLIDGAGREKLSPAGLSLKSNS